MTVLAAGRWRTNADMIADVARLYIDLENDLVLDPTYGEGGFWRKVRPGGLIATDIEPDKSIAPPTDFRRMPFQSDWVDVVTFDPPYVSPGGRKTSKIDQMNETYGMHTTETTPTKQWLNVIEPGAYECWRVLKPGGVMMWKGQNYISSGKYHDYLSKITDRMATRFEVIDIFIFARPKGGPQPGGRRQVHARNNWSFLVVGRKL